MRRLAPIVAGRRAATLLGAAGALGACASPSPPPGGPEDRSPPRLLRVTPDTNAVDVRAREVLFTFDEVVSESPRGGGGGGGGTAAGEASGLAQIFTISPRSGAVNVDWRRQRLAVRPTRGFRANTTYTVTLEPGLADLRNNVRDSATVIVFSTGGAIARGSVGGVVFDWINGTPAARAVVEAIAPDSTTYVAIADSVGRFLIRNMPPAAYVVRGAVDVNGNRAADPREAFDTATVLAPAVARGDTAAVELYAFVRDTLGSRVTTVVVRDSVTLRLTFDRALDPRQTVTAAQVRLAGADSVPVPVTDVLTPAAYDSLEARQREAATDSAARADTSAAARTRRATLDSLARATRADSLARAARADSVARARLGGRRRPDSAARRAPEMRRPKPITELVVRLASPLRPTTAYRLTARDVRSLSGVVRTSERQFSTPRPERSAAPAPASTPRPAGAPPTGTPPPGTAVPVRPPTGTPAPGAPPTSPARPDTAAAPRDTSASRAPARSPGAR